MIDSKGGAFRFDCCLATSKFRVFQQPVRRPVEAAVLKGLGVRAGVPDLIACRGGRFYALELKTDTGKLSDAQEQVFAALREAGAEVAVTYGLDAALAQLERWQLLRGVAS
jgi:hypothetical protein